MNNKTMPDDLLAEVLTKTYNKWFAKWKNKRGLTKYEYGLMVDEINYIKNRYPDYPFVENLLIVFLNEIEARQHGGYKEMPLISWNYNEGFEINRGDKQ
ncbi:MAG: hypothetical protein ACOYBV_07685 [Candidatus Avilachnospira sp.]|jgi:hypothetical protein